MEPFPPKMKITKNGVISISGFTVELSFMVIISDIYVEMYNIAGDAKSKYRHKFVVKQSSFIINLGCLIKYINAVMSYFEELEAVLLTDMNAVSDYINDNWGIFVVESFLS